MPGPVGQQAITWTNVDQVLWRDMAAGIIQVLCIHLSTVLQYVLK